MVFIVLCPAFLNLLRLYFPTPTCFVMALILLGCVYDVFFSSLFALRRLVVEIQQQQETEKQTKKRFEKKDLVTTKVTAIEVRA